MSNHQLATMVKLKTTENAQEFVMLDFTIKTELVFSVDAQMDSKIMDLEVVSALLFQLEDVNHQLSDSTEPVLIIAEMDSSLTATPELAILVLSTAKTV